MTVQELIDKLQELKDKESDIKIAVFIAGRTVYASIDRVEKNLPIDIGYKCALIYSK